MTMNRESVSFDVSFADSASLSGAFDMRGAAGLQIIMPAAWTTADIGFKISTAINGTFVPLYDDEGTLIFVDGPAASKAYNAPPELYPSQFAKLWSINSTGTAVVQTAARTVTLALKT
jgi:hypothetical protein